MEFVSGYRDPVLEYSELLFSWYRRYMKDYAGRLDRLAIHPQQETKIKSLPYDATCWFLHVLHNDSIAFRPRNTELQIRDVFYMDDALRFRDLKKYISFINLQEETEGETSTRDANAANSDDVRHIKYLLLVAIETGAVIGVDFLMDNECSGKKVQYVCKLRAYHLLCQCMALPMDNGQPRRPQRVAIGDPSVHRFLVKILSSLGVGVQKTPMRDWSSSATFLFSAQTVQCCHVCKRRKFEVMLTPCDTCDAVLYCSEDCKMQNWKKSPWDVSHEFWCEKMKRFMQYEERLADLPFHFIKEVTSRLFDKELFLSSRNLIGGYWTVESIHYHTSHLQGKSPAWNLEEGRGEPLLKHIDVLRLQPKERLKSTLLSWKEYYNWRGLSLDNPLAALLTYPLTIYYIISTLVPQHFPELNILKKQSMKIHIMAGGQEYHNILLFWELVLLMPHVVLELVFVGSDLPVEEDDRSFIILKKGSEVHCSDLTYVDKDRGARGIHVKVHARPYHTLQVAKPDLVIGFNSGFGLDDTWLSTLPRLQAMKVPAFFSDCSQYSCEVDGQVVSGASGGSASLPILNPFRSPLRIVATDNNMPWYKNAFLFYLIYKSNHISTKRNNHVPYSALQAPSPDTAAEASPQKKKNKSGRNQCKKRK
ncbi:zinc finger MYND domain-containing protein 15 [Bufo gargarizans]|uniref:zinc finger MYND domain-containing protein 15 n=1 Tax=Bufo gargarizans TaxID=30331 RepID=UPI001CF4F0D5|nr:zinc finger MYND domain-containing protein 15 [Bufo gargarizans]XP_044134422.1 zinc finger MYND domain-containing protein 15 [Bufo gargarizans]